LGHKEGIILECDEPRYGSSTSRCTNDASRPMFWTAGAAAKRNLVDD